MGNNPHEQPSINIFYHLSTPLFKQFNYAQVNCTFAPGSGLILWHDYEWVARGQD
jgi:hypothetical protein